MNNLHSSDVHCIFHRFVQRFPVEIYIQLQAIVASPAALKPYVTGEQ
jgi:hypothetical protein